MKKLESDIDTKVLKPINPRVWMVRKINKLTPTGPVHMIFCDEYSNNKEKGRCLCGQKYPENGKIVFGSVDISSVYGKNMASQTVTCKVCLKKMGETWKKEG